MREPNLFVYFHDRLRRRDENGVEIGERRERPGGWENALTEAVAFYLSCDRTALVKLVEHVTGVKDDPPKDVGTQLREPEGIPDLVIRRQSGNWVIIECKVDADLGDRQLERYLAILKKTGGHVALFSRRSQRIPKKCRESPFYRRPANRDHFHWEDLHAVIASLGSEEGRHLRSHFLRYLERLGFERMDPEERLLLGPREQPEPKKHQEAFGRKLARAWAMLERKGFRVSSVSHKGLQAEPRRSSVPYRHMVVWPASPRTAYVPEETAQLVRGAVLVVGFVFDKGAERRVARFYEAVPRAFTDDAGRHWVAIPPRRIGGQRLRVEVVSSLDWFLKDSQRLEERLERAVTSVLQTVESRAQATKRSIQAAGR